MKSCVKCGNEQLVGFIGEDGFHEALCQECFNELIAEEYSDIIPEHIPNELVMKDIDNIPHVFSVEFRILGHCTTLCAFEGSENGYSCKVLGKLDEDFKYLWNRLYYRLHEILFVKYIENDQWIEDRIVGYVAYNDETNRHDLIVDGKSYSWEEIGNHIGTYEGFQVKIEVIDPSDEVY